MDHAKVRGQSTEIRGASGSAYSLNYCSSAAFTADSTCQCLQERITVAPNQSTPLGVSIPARA